VLTAIGLWLLFRDVVPGASGAESRVANEPTEISRSPPADRAVRRAPVPTAVAASSAPARAPALQSAADDYDQTPGQPSHPITPERERLQQEIRLAQALNDAMDLKDGARLRELIREHSELFPEDGNQVREGYEIVADCLERPGPSATGAARRYFDTRRGSTLRRFVHRFCLEPHD
jgi:hypothetical protein